MNRRFLWQNFCCWTITLAFGTGSLWAAPPLHQQIDTLIGLGDAEFEKTAAPLADDATFLRRVYLDLTGTIPSANEVRAFLTDKAADKRVKLVDRLLTSPRHARHLQYTFDAMLMERRPDKNVPADQWRGFLRQSFLQNKPWDKIVREILTADGSDEKTRPAAKFLLDREMKIDVVTRDLGRMFLGRDMQCAQCHDHPNVDDYLQRHYYGLTAFLNRSYLFKDPKTKKTSIGEKAEGLVKFTSVFTNESDETSPRMLDLPAIADPPAAKEPYKVKPAKNVRSVPVYSRRLLLAEAMTSPQNSAFRSNIANRLWAMMMGRGIVEPLDMWHSDNPPSNPKLLDLLTNSLADHKFDMRFLLREIALSKSYQRSSRLSEKVQYKPESYSVGLLKPLSPEQLAWAMMQATGLTEQTLADLKAKQIKSDPKKGAEQIKNPLWQEEALHKALKSHVDSFATMFGVIGIQTSRFDASADQALFLRNGNVLQSWLEFSGRRLTARLKKLDAPAKIAEEFYLSVFSRFPSAAETEQVKQFLDESKDNRDEALKQLVWAALSSAEFRFNH